MDRFQRFQTSSRTGRPVCGSSGSQPIGLEPEPEPVMTDANILIGSRTGTPRSAAVLTLTRPSTSSRTAPGHRSTCEPLDGQRTSLRVKCS